MNNPEGDLPQSFAPENGDDGQPGVKPVTFAQRLREGALTILRDFRGVSLRISTYVAASTVELTALMMSGVPNGNAFLITTATLIPSMVVGEFFAFNRLSRRLPWFRVSYVDFSKRNPQNRKAA